MAPVGLLTGVPQLYFVPEGIILPLPSVGVLLNVYPLQIVSLIFEINGVGFTVITKSLLLPVQPFAVGVTLYVTVPLMVELLLMVMAGMVDTEVFELPLITVVILADFITSHVKVVPLTLDVNGIADVLVPEQML